MATKKKVTKKKVKKTGVDKITAKSKRFVRAMANDVSGGAGMGRNRPKKDGALTTGLLLSATKDSLPKGAAAKVRRGTKDTVAGPIKSTKKKYSPKGRAKSSLSPYGFK